jgi:hypothetical protein
MNPLIGKGTVIIIIKLKFEVHTSKESHPYPFHAT